MPKTDPTTLGLDEYVPVAERIALFYQRFPVGRILTRLVESSPDVVVVQASVYRSESERQPSATGWASERPGDGDINTVACLENTETSAIGRALANLGFHATRSRPSYQASSPPSSDSLPSRESSVLPESLGIRTVYGSPVRVRGPTHPPSTDAGPPVVHQAVGAASEAPRSLSAIARDFIRLVDDAERQGLRPRRAAEWRVRVESGLCADADLERLEVSLRAWVSRVRERRAEADAREV